MLDEFKTNGRSPPRGHRARGVRRRLERCQIIYPTARYRSALRAFVKQAATEVVGDAIRDRGWR